MATTVALGSGVRNDGGKILGGGANTSSRWGVISIRDSIDSLFQTKTPSTVGYINKPLTGGTYDVMAAGEYVARLVNTKLAGDTTKNIKSPASDYYRTPYSKFISYNRLNITSWDYVTGHPTYGVNRGAKVYLQGANPSGDLTTGEPFPTRAVPGELVFMYGAPDPKMADYQPITG